MASIELQNVTKLYGTVRALHRVSALVPSGSLAVVRGANGAGKSTLLSCIAGLCRPTAGRVLVGGEPPTGPAQRTIRYIMKELGLYELLTVRENLELCAAVLGIAKSDAVEKEISAFSLDRVADRQIGACSQGMAKRVALARACLGAPAVILCDEPFANLDEQSATVVEARLGAARDAGATVVVSTHDAERAARIADDYITLADGAVVADAAVRAVAGR